MESKSVSTYLDEIDYARLESYIPSDETLEFVNFMHLCSEGELENATPAVHLLALDIAFKNNDPTAIMCHRGFAKTTLYAEMLILYIAAFGKMPIKGFEKVKFLIYIGDSIENGVKSLRKNIEFRYQNSEYLKTLIPNMAIKYVDENGSEDESDMSAGRKFTDVRLEFVNKRGDHFVTRMYGAQTGVRGAKELGRRPEVAIIDDILSDEDARSDTIINSIENTIHKAVKHALNPIRQKIIWLGTPFNAKDPLYKAVESGAYNVACFPVCEKFPVSKEEFRGSWEDRFNYEYVRSSYEAAIKLKKPDSFYQELMLQIISDEDRLLQDNDIVWYDRTEILKNRENFNFYITSDLAVSEKKSADFSVLSVWAINNNGDYLLVDGFCEKVLADKWIEKMFSYALSYKPLGVGIEVSGQQLGFISWVITEMVRRNTYFNILSEGNNGDPGIRPVGDKFSRFTLFLPRFKHRKIWFPTQMKGSPWMNEAEEELRKASKGGFKSKHDDILDTISMLGSFEAYRPSEAMPRTKEEREVCDMFEVEDEYEIRNTIF